MIIIGTKPMSLVNIVANPFTGTVHVVFNKEAAAIYGPAYLGIARQQLENALEAVEREEKCTYVQK